MRTAHKKAFPYEGKAARRSRDEEVGQLRPRGTVHLISRLRRQLPLIGEAMDVCPSSLPWQGSLCGLRNFSSGGSYA